MTTRIIERIERELGLPGLAARLAGELEPTDLQSLMLEVYRLRAARTEPAAVLAAYESNRFVKASAVSPLRLLEWDRTAFAQLPPEFEPVELSPVCPLGSCSVVAGVAQDWSVSTARNTEVVSDPTNVLALEAARRRREMLRRDARDRRPVHLAASQRVVRGQRYPNPTSSQHFRLFALVSAGRGGAGFERESLALHLRSHLAALRAHLAASVALRVSLTVLEPDDAFAAAADELCADLRARFDGVQCGLDPARQAGRGYYRSLCFHIHGRAPSGEELQLADGGAVPWMRRLLSDAKERLVVSGVGSDRVSALADAGRPARGDRARIG
jgi:hypothetical protein